jgi:hypothetical protein
MMPAGRLSIKTPRVMTRERPPPLTRLRNYA